MGAGCYYTHKCNKEKAYWVEIPKNSGGEPEEYDDFQTENLLDDLEDSILSLGYSKEDSKRSLRRFENGLFIVDLKSTYYGDGVIIEINPRFDYSNWGDGVEYSRYYHLAMANHSRAERRIAKAINKYYSLFYATSGYTAAEIKPGQLK